MSIFKKLAVPFIVLSAALSLTMMGQASADTLVAHPGTENTSVRNCHSNQPIAGKHMYICGTVNIGEDAIPNNEHYWSGWLDIYCFLNGNNSSLVPCTSFAASVQVSGAGWIQYTCGQGSPNGPCSGNGFRLEGPANFSGATSGCHGNDGNTSSPTSGGYVSVYAPYLSAQITGTSMNPWGTFWYGLDNKVCFF